MNVSGFNAMMYERYIDVFKERSTAENFHDEHENGPKRWKNHVHSTVTMRSSTGSGRSTGSIFF
jgi:hypothetical protein